MAKDRGQTKNKLVAADSNTDKYAEQLTPPLQPTIDIDPFVLALRISMKAALKESGLSLQQVGEAMGHPPIHARTAVWTLLNRINNPTIESLVRFANAIGYKFEGVFKKIDKS